MQKSKHKQKKSVGVVPFKRVNEDVLVDPRLQDNSFEAKVSVHVMTHEP